MKYKCFILGPIETNCYVIYDNSGNAVIIDPVIPSEELLAFPVELGLAVKGIFITHSHVDHVHGAKETSERFQVPIYMHSGAEKLRSFYHNSCSMLGFELNNMPDKYLPAEKIESFEVGNEAIKIITTPGHSPCGISLVSNTFVITGDLLFKDCIGRYDLPFASLPVLYNSLKKIKSLSPELEVLPGHGPLSTLKRELLRNEYLNKIP